EIIPMYVQAASSVDSTIWHPEKNVENNIKSRAAEGRPAFPGLQSRPQQYLTFLASNIFLDNYITLYECRI
ncbi:MAG: hypothetical protein AAGD96_30475, partial [Chloroflexota bacterium]